MTILLRIDASVPREGSHSRGLGDEFVARWKRAFPDGSVICRDLAATPVPHLDADALSAFFTPDLSNARGQAALSLSDELISELEHADDVLVTSAVYNFNSPSTLKAYADHVVRRGRTISYSDNGPVGLLGGRRAFLITSRGGVSPREPDCQIPFLNAFFRYIGFDQVRWAALEGTTGDPTLLRRLLDRTQREIEQWFIAPRQVDSSTCNWRGLFTNHDRDAITALRNDQMNAILTGDPDAYARLCTDDVLLMLQGREPVCGLADFIDTERQLFSRTRFLKIIQTPRRIERDGNLTVESGDQVAEAVGLDTEARQYGARRKYTHVLRRTSDGWKFAVLMSSNNT